MRPPDLPGGNPSTPRCSFGPCGNRFNEAAGFTRRKLENSGGSELPGSPRASMRPPDLPGGNISDGTVELYNMDRSFNEAAGFTRRKRR